MRTALPMGTIKIINVGSGSKGNATFFFDGKTLIQIDMGIAKTTVNECLKEINKSIADVDALLITHNHNDHIKGLANIKYENVYAPYLEYASDELHLIRHKKKIKIGDFEITCFSSSHDAPYSANFVIKHNKTKIVYVTDTGIIKKSAKSLLNNANLYYFESNYDLEMLENSGRPIWLINRIKGDKGHLGNVQAGEYLSLFIGDKTEKILLAHLSEDCNRPEIAYEEVKRIIQDNGVNFNFDNLVLTKQYEPTFEELYED